MNIVKKMSKKKLLETYKNNYEVVLKRKKELYDTNIELQKEIRAQYIEIENLKKEKKVLKGKLTKATKELDRVRNIEIAPSIENGNKILEQVFGESDSNEQ